MIYDDLAKKHGDFPVRKTIKSPEANSSFFKINSKAMVLQPGHGAVHCLHQVFVDYLH